MALTRSQKEQTVATVQTNVSDAVSAVFVTFDGLSITDMGELRDQLFEAGCSMQVVPKRLLGIAVKNAGIDFDPRAHEGQIAVVWGSDAVAPAKVLHKFAKDKDNVQLRAGVLEGESISDEQITALAKLPSKEQLIGQLLSVLNGPARGFATVLAAVPRDFVYALSAIKDKKEA